MLEVAITEKLPRIIFSFQPVVRSDSILSYNQIEVQTGLPCLSPREIIHYKDIYLSNLREP